MVSNRFYYQYEYKKFMCWDGTSFPQNLHGKISVETFTNNLTIAKETKIFQPRNELNPFMSTQINWENTIEGQSTCQLHSCTTQYCLRQRDGKTSQYCRFEFPKPLFNRTKLILLYSDNYLTAFPQFSLARNNRRLNPTNLIYLLWQARTQISNY